MPRAAVRDDLALYYELRGAGAPVLFIGGTGGDLRRVPHALDRLLAARFHTLFFDQRGQGRSDKPDVPCTMADYAADALALLDHLGWERCAVLGYSFGGMVAQELALGAPQRVERLVLMSTTSGGAGGASYPLHELQELPPEARARRFLELSDLRRTPAWQAENGALFAAMLQDTLANLRLAEDAPAAAAGARRQLAARRGHDTWTRLPQLAVPTDVLAGRHDGIAPVAHQRALAERIPDARFHVFEGGHLFYLQLPAAARAVAQALAGRGAAIAGGPGDAA